MEQCCDTYLTEVCTISAYHIPTIFGYFQSTYMFQCLTTSTYVCQQIVSDMFKKYLVLSFFFTTNPCFGQGGYLGCKKDVHGGTRNSDDDQIGLSLRLKLLSGCCINHFYFLVIRYNQYYYINHWRLVFILSYFQILTIKALIILKACRSKVLLPRILHCDHCGTPKKCRIWGSEDLCFLTHTIPT